MNTSPFSHVRKLRKMKCKIRNLDYDFCCWFFNINPELPSCESHSENDVFANFKYVPGFKRKSKSMNDLTCIKKVSFSRYIRVKFIPRNNESFVQNTFDTIMIL